MNQLLEIQIRFTAQRQATFTYRDIPGPFTHYETYRGLQQLVAVGVLRIVKPKVQRQPAIYALIK